MPLAMQILTVSDHASLKFKCFPTFLKWIEEMPEQIWIPWMEDNKDSLDEMESRFWDK